jgi:hypothetical protein
MDTCTVEVGLLRKKPCGHAAVARCLNCEQPLCVEHAVPQHSESGQKTGKFICKDCQAAEKDYAKSMAAVAKTQKARKLAEIDKNLREQAAAPPPVKKPAAAKPPAPEEAPPAEAPKPSEALEFPSKDGSSGYTTKKD